MFSGYFFFLPLQVFIDAFMEEVIWKTFDQSVDSDKTLSAINSAVSVNF